MNILVTGNGVSGSWVIRGGQLGAAIGATVQPKAPTAAGFDLAVVVKKLQAPKGAPIVYDVVDSWPQPVGNTWSRDECMAWLRSQILMIKPVGIVAATKAMAGDCAEFGLPVLALPHHARPGLRRNPIRPQVRTVGYEGSPRHLGAWAAVLESQCRQRGWRFVVNPEHLAELDIVVALREHNGYAPRNWKSNVKLANAQGSGTPCIVGRESGYVETASGGECWADTAQELDAALTLLADQRMRESRAQELIEGTITLASVAGTYREWLSTLV